MFSDFPVHAKSERRIEHRSEQQGDYQSATAAAGYVPARTLLGCRLPFEIWSQSLEICEPVSASAHLGDLTSGRTCAVQGPSKMVHLHWRGFCALFPSLSRSLAFPPLPPIDDRVKRVEFYGC